MAKRTKEKVRLFELAVKDAETGRQILAGKFSRFGLRFVSLSVLVAICAVIFCLIAFTPIRTAIPGYPDARSRSQAIHNAIMIDSLETIVNRWEFYAENLRRVVDGEAPIAIDSLIRRQHPDSVAADAADFAGKDSLLREDVTGSMQFDLSESGRSLPLDALHFYSPLKGVVSRAYDPVLHPYIDITAPSGSLVLAVLDGTVVFDGWNDEAGYTIAVQHDGDILTVYKHNQKLLKKTGDKVAAGSTIALVGESADKDKGDHLHFELWYKGTAVDPTRFINF